VGQFKRFPRVLCSPARAQDQALRTHGCPGSRDIHRISGSGTILPLLGESQLREMGFSLVGPRLLFGKALRKVQKGLRMQQRNQVLWQAEENRLGPWGGCLPYAFPFCCCAQPPASYKLNAYKLSLTTLDASCPLCAQCCGYSFSTSNIDLTNIEDVDVIATEPCCSYGMGVVVISCKHSAGAESYHFYVHPEEVQEISQKIQMATEEAALRSHATIQDTPGQVF